MINWLYRQIGLRRKFKFTQEELERIQPCPSCDPEGLDDKSIHWEFNPRNGIVYCVCGDCGFSTQHDDIEDAVIHWNSSVVEEWVSVDDDVPWDGNVVTVRGEGFFTGASWMPCGDLEYGEDGNALFTPYSFCTGGGFEVKGVTHWMSMTRFTEEHREYWIYKRDQKWED